MGDDDVAVSSRDQKEMHAEDMRKAALEAALKFFELSGNKPFPSHVLQTAREYEKFIFGR